MNKQFSALSKLIPFFAAAFIVLLYSGCTKESGDEVTLATVYTLAVTHQTPVSATIGGNITSSGGATVTERGVVYGSTANPTILSAANTILGGGSGTGSFTVDMTGLVPNATYYARAYAINSKGTAYGSDVVVAAPEPAVGVAYEGGTIFYMFQPGDAGYVAGQKHGLIVAPADQSADAPWYCTGNTVLNVPGAYHDEIGAGLANTIAIHDSCNATYIAASLCLNYSVDGYSDWYLPSRNEMHEMIAFLHSLGISGYYWSSSMPSQNRAWVQSYGATELYMPLDDGYKVRAIRSF